MDLSLYDIPDPVAQAGNTDFGLVPSVNDTDENGAKSEEEGEDQGNDDFSDENEEQQKKEVEENENEIEKDEEENEKEKENENENEQQHKEEEEVEASAEEVEETDPLTGEIIKKSTTVSTAASTQSSGKSDLLSSGSDSLFGDSLLGDDEDTDVSLGLGTGLGTGLGSPSTKKSLDGGSASKPDDEADLFNDKLFIF